MKNENSVRVVKGVMTKKTARKYALRFLSGQVDRVGEATMTELDIAFVVKPVLGEQKSFPFAE